ncbi:MAG: GDP-L-fucose synthase [Parcubacteria bacterium C7867-006]|nr:MAG: GDP-L-fucose synthase [Parcubacteria bacterium C7867-006]
MEKLNILITGANGFVGKSLVEKLITNNLFLVSRDSGFKYSGAHVYYGDLSDEGFCKNIVKNIDIVYYLAGYKENIAFHTKNPNDFVVGNVKPVISFLEAVKGSSVKQIIYLSSTNVGLYKDGEEDGYVVGKYINELILKSFTKQFGVDIKIVRSAGIYGPGDNFNPETANFIPSMINKVFNSSGDISVWGTGKRQMQFVYIDDLVSSLIEVSNLKDNFFIVGNEEVLTINDITSKIIRLSNKGVGIINDPTKPDKPTKLFDFNNPTSPKIDFENGLKKTIEYYKSIK